MNTCICTILKCERMFYCVSTCACMFFFSFCLAYTSFNTNLGFMEELPQVSPPYLAQSEGDPSSYLEFTGHARGYPRHHHPPPPPPPPPPTGKGKERRLYALLLPQVNASLCCSLIHPTSLVRTRSIRVRSVEAFTPRAHFWLEQFTYAEGIY